MEESVQAMGGANPSLVVLVSWLLTFAVGKFFSKRGQLKLRALLPSVALLTAVAIEVIFTSLSGQSLSWGIVLKALGEAGTAVIAHSQFREVMKRSAPPVVHEAVHEADHESVHEADHEAVHEEGPRSS